MISGILGYLLVSLLISVIIHGVREEDYPVTKATPGLMIVWPLYLIKWIVLGVVWLIDFIGMSIVDAVKGLR